MFPRYYIEVNQSNQDGHCHAVVVEGVQSGPMFVCTGPSVLGVLSDAVDAISEVETKGAPDA